ncbi:GNAT family N-acetyltransferase [Bordetella holmesii]|uniref:FR47-like protein n=2 Tax=Bordetella holmesii TaxID=35814 RepID=A0A158M140_9BORD|nr:GNAT family N-acetyltransferase [Bordetella holmesii]AIT25193.1 acetyltransferase family protein [Bordetella holmesii 44057]EWM45760.1 acetyltransferase family protein [Bordetella holmesii 70147]EWM48653.1 acetyltransferase family protein [Bordetella holmesii 41130]EWM49887.1 acetyltransferase family protein [Bordetella holmesii 35009]AMD44422.1 acetyltransferase [Bordetella holmesii H558]
MQTFTIRQLTPQDASEFKSLRLAALCEAPEAFGSSYEEEQLVTVPDWARKLEPSAARTVFGAWDGSRLVGCAGLMRMGTLKQMHKAVIWGIYVAPAQRNHGLGRRLLGAALQQAAGWTDVRQVLLTVAQGNPAALRLYESLGFTAYGCEPAALRVGGRYLDETLMIKRL